VVATPILHKPTETVWALVREQHGVVARWQLLDLGFTPAAVRHRLAIGRLHRTEWRGVYAVGRPALTQEGEWMAAVLACGPGAYLSHLSAARLWRLLPKAPRNPIHITLKAPVFRHRPGIQVHRTRSLADGDVTTHSGIPVTTPIRTLIDLATVLDPYALEAAVNEACVLDLTDPESLRAELDRRKGQRGVPALRPLLDRHTFRLTESELERRFLRIVRRAGLPLPDTQVQVGGRTDFHWPDLGLVVETDGWRYHRTPAQQARDNRRMQAHAAAARTAVRFSHYEVRYEAARVESVLAGLVSPAAT
jgi:very-short-patch-repair endonuclease